MPRFHGSTDRADRRCPGRRRSATWSTSGRRCVGVAPGDLPQRAFRATGPRPMPRSEQHHTAELDPRPAEVRRPATRSCPTRTRRRLGRSRRAATTSAHSVTASAFNDPLHPRRRDTVACAADLHPAAQTFRQASTVRRSSPVTRGRDVDGGDVPQAGQPAELPLHRRTDVGQRRLRQRQVGSCDTSVSWATVAVDASSAPSRSVATDAPRSR